MNLPEQDTELKEPHLWEETERTNPATHSADTKEYDEDFFEGWEENIWASPWLRRNGLFIGFITLCGLICIGWPYIYMMNVREITALEQKLKDIRYKALFISAERIEYERINNITERVKEHGLQLVPASQPPYLLLDTGQCGRPSPQDLPEANR